MRRGNISSVADAIPFDPNSPNFAPGVEGQHFRWNESTKLFEPSDLVDLHRFAALPDSTIISANGTLSLTVDSNLAQVLSGSGSNYSIVLPNATTLKIGWKFEIYNLTSNTITLKYNNGSTLFVIAQQTICYIYLYANGSSNGQWTGYQVLASSVASGIINYNLVTNTAYSTSTRFPSFSTITGFTLTPQAGTYACWYNSSVFYTTTPKIHYWAFYKNGTQIADSLRSQDTAHADQNMSDSTMTITTFDGTETIDVRVSCANTGTLTVNQRSMLLIRIGT